MGQPVKLYDLAPSPNNIKARLALAYKEIPYERIPVDPANREPVIKVSGQPLTPVLLHGTSVVYDSYAITRYLDANWPSPPRLYSTDRETMKTIEAWELFTRTDGSAAVGICFGEFFSSSPDAEKLRRANDLANRAASRVEEALTKSRYLVGDAPTAADFALAPMLFYAALPETVANANRITTFFSRHLELKGAPRTREWLTRVMAWDREPRPGSGGRGDA
jgi:glutathione S-transferase